MSQDKNQLILDVKNLVVRYETEDGVVHAVNGIDLQLGYRARPSAWWGRPAQARPPPPWPSSGWCRIPPGWWSATG